MHDIALKTKANTLRKRGSSYTSISRALGVSIPKSTLSYWFRNIQLSPTAKQRVEARTRGALARAQQAAHAVLKEKRRRYLTVLVERNKHLAGVMRDLDTAKIALAMLYLGEGTKSPGMGSMVFANSDPETVRLFLALLRLCYAIDENKFRCTLQCRADQDIGRLQSLWTLVTNIPLAQFYRARIDPRTIGKPSQKPDYKGVCRIDYLSADTYHDLMRAIEVLKTNPPQL